MSISSVNFKHFCNRPFPEINSDNFGQSFSCWVGLQKRYNKAIKRGLELNKSQL